MKERKMLSTLGSNEKGDWTEEWKDMPEFIQEKQRPYKMLIVRFETKENYEEFQKLIGQELTEKTKSIWHPKLKVGEHSDKRYINES
jgi:hypothetical protein